MKNLFRVIYGLVAIPLIVLGGLVSAENGLIVHDTTGGTITVYTGDFSYGITIQDKNLGTSIVGTGESSYGYYFQWGNNHGNYWNSETSNTLLEWNSGYDNKGYDGPETGFILSGNSNYDIWADNELHDNVWGGGNDNDDSNPNIIKGYDIEDHKATNVTGRQGPCPDGYHVPSAGEWQELVILWCYANPEICDNVTNIYKEGIGTVFSDDMKLPVAGSRNIYGDIIAKTDARYRSSSSFSGNKGVWILHLDSNFVMFNDNDIVRVLGQPIRCFKNEYVVQKPQTYTLTFLDDGVKVRTGEVVDGESWTGNISAPNGKRGYKFDYRYVDGGDNTTGFDFNTPITGNIILHAHWTLVQSLPNGIVTNEDGSKTIVRGDTVLTVAGEDLGTYEWGTTSIGQSYSSDNNAWGGSGDNGENGYDNGKERYKRQGPCDTGWHIPSAGERSSLIISWCNLTEDCEIVYDFNGFPSINNSSMLQKFIEELNLLNEKRYRASSPYYYVWLLGSIYIQDQSNGTNSYEVRCFKNYITVPQIFEVTFIDEGRHIWSGDILSGDKIPSEIISQKNLTGLTKEGYTFSGWVISESNEKFDVENGIVTTGMILNAMRDKNQYTIRFDTDGGNNINSITAYYGDNITVPADPTKNGYRFIRREPEIPTTIPSKNLTVKAIWEKIGSSGGGGGSSNGGSSSKSQTTNSLSSSKSETTNNLSLSIGNKNPDINERIEIIIDTDEKYTGIVNFTKMQYYSEGKWMNISMTSKNYVSDYSDEVEAGYIRFSSSDKGRIKISKFIKISQKGNYRIYVEDKDGYKDYVEFRVGNGENINNDTEEEVYISRSCKKYIIKYDEELGVFTSPNLLKKEYFINKEYFKRYIDSKNKQIDGCPTNKWNLVRYKDNSNNTDRHVAPNGKVYFIEGQQGRFYSNEINKELNRLTSFSTIQELKNYIMGRNPITPIVNK